MGATSSTIKLGDKGVKRIGLGTNRVTDTPEARELLRHAAEIGLNFIDTANIYQNGQSEATIGETFAPYPEHIVIGTKGGMVRGADPDNSEQHLRHALEESLRRLRLETIFLYQLHRIDARIPIEETMELFKQFQKEGKILHIGLSNASLEQIERARAVANIASVQNEYNLGRRDDDPVIDYCQEHGIVYIPWFPLSRGDLGHTGALEEIASRLGKTPHQIALAWLLKRSSAILPIPGTLSIAHLEENLSALEIKLSQEDFEKISNTEN